VLDLVISFFTGLIGGVAIQAYLRPLSARIERLSRRRWADPLIVSVERDPSIIWSGEPDWVPFSVYIDDPTRLPAAMPGGRQEWMQAARSINAVDAFSTQLKVTLQARTEAAVVVERVRVVSHKQAPVNQGMILTRATGGADLEPRRFEIELDWGPEPLITWLHGGPEARKPPGLKMSAGDVERFHIWAKTSYDSEQAVWHEWTIALDLLVEGVKTERTISDNGQPFVTVSRGQLPHRMKYGDVDEWTDGPPLPGGHER
jgi:hypothetical protein